MKTTVEQITPAIANQYLETMPHYQRNPIKSSIAKMAKDMQNGRWITTHQGIAFNPQGQLIDGQHRMKAIVLSGVTTEMIVFRDVPEDSWHTIDIGRKRDLSAITGIQKKEVEAYRSACDFGLKVREPSFQDIETIQNSLLGETIRELLIYAPTTRRLVSAAPVRVVVAIWKIKSKSQYPFDQYKALVLQHYNMMSQASQSLNRQIEAAAAGTRKVTTYDMAARAYRVFDPAASDLSKIQITDIGSVTERIGMDIREIIYG